MRKLVILAALVGLSACVRTVGAPVADDKIAALQDGSTTVDQAIALLGPPNTDLRNSGGLHILSYGYIRAQAGPFGAGASSQLRNVTLTFDANGLLIQHTVTDSQYGR